MNLGFGYSPGRKMRPARSVSSPVLTRQASGAALSGRWTFGAAGKHAVAGAIALAAALTAIPLPASATKIERIVSPGGITAWTVYDPDAPLIALDFSFKGGSAQDPAEKAGLANMAMSLLDEGAGDIDGKEFHERVAAKAIILSFSASSDDVSGSLRTLTENGDEAARLLKLALTAPRFESADVERVRAQVLTGLRDATTSPSSLAGERFAAAAFPDHPYGRPGRGTLTTVPAITADDLRAYARNVFARDNLKVAIVGNIDAATGGRLLDDVFGSLPAKATLAPVPDAVPQGLGQKITIDLDVPQSMMVVGGPGIQYKDPDFMPALVLEHILGSDATLSSSRLYKEVREARGLAYSAYSTMLSLEHAAVFMSVAGTRSERAAEALEVMQEEIRKLAETGPTEEELARAKSYLTGSYVLNLDTSPKISSLLVAIQFYDLGIDYIDRRSSLVNAVTMDDVKRVAKRLLGTSMLVTVVGKPQPAPATGG
jgi:zinc protease